MSVEIEFFERTGSPFTDEEVFNCNWKNDTLQDSLYKYYYYPIRRPEDPTWVKHSVTKFMYAKISGTYGGAKRPRWKLTGMPMTDGVRLYVGQSDTYENPPTDTFNGALTFVGSDPVYVYPQLSLTGPTSGLQRVTTLADDTTYYSGFLVTQLWVDDTSAYVGNTDILTLEFELDEYE